MVDFEFDIDGTEPAEDFSPVPPDTYTLICSATDIKKTQAGTGEYLACEFEIVDDAYKGRKLWNSFTLENPNAMARQIGRGQLSGMCRAMNISGMLQDTNQLHGKLVKAKVVIENDDKGIARNRIKAFASASGDAPKKTTKATATTGAKPPWKK